MCDKFNAHQHLRHQDFTCSRLFTGVFDLLKSGSSSSHAGPGLPASRKAASFPVQHHFRFMELRIKEAVWRFESVYASIFDTFTFG